MIDKMVASSVVRAHLRMGIQDQFDYSFEETGQTEQ